MSYGLQIGLHQFENSPIRDTDFGSTAHKHRRVSAQWSSHLGRHCTRLHCHADNLRRQRHAHKHVRGPHGQMHVRLEAADIHTDAKQPSFTIPVPTLQFLGFSTPAAGVPICQAPPSHHQTPNPSKPRQFPLQLLTDSRKFGCVDHQTAFHSLECGKVQPIWRSILTVILQWEIQLQSAVRICLCARRGREFFQGGWN